MAKSAGRPKSTEGRELIDLDECIRRATEQLNGHCPWTKRTLRNKICLGEFERFGSYRVPQVDWLEVRKSLHWKPKKKVS